MISVYIGNPNEAPIVLMNGVRVPLVSFEHSYVTKDEYSNGIHSYEIKYIDKESNTIKTIGYEKQ